MPDSIGGEHVVANVDGEVGGSVNSGSLHILGELDCQPVIIKC